MIAAGRILALAAALLVSSSGWAADSMPATRTVDAFADDPIANGSVALRSEITVRLARFLAATGNPFTALAELLAAEQRNAISLQRGPAAQRFAEWLQVAGLHQRAGRVAAASAGDWPATAHDAFWLAQARLLLRLNLPTQAETSLSALKAALAEDVRDERRRLLAQSLLEQQRYNHAVTALESQQGQTRNNLYDRYNLAVAWMGMGRVLEAAGVLDDIGQIPAESAELLALRDRANLALGWAWMNAGQGGSARPLLRRIRQQGPDSTHALLGLGWAELTVDGDPQSKFILRQQGCMEDPARVLGNNAQLLRRPPRDSCEAQRRDVFRKREALPFEVGGDERTRHERALTAWRPLLDLPADQPAVREALLATAESWRALDARSEARTTYRLTIERLTREQVALNTLIAALGSAKSDPVAVLARDAHRRRLTTWRASRDYAAVLRQRALLDQTQSRLAQLAQRMQTLKPHARSRPEQQRVQRMQQRWTALRAAATAIRKDLDQRVRDDAIGKLRDEHRAAGDYLGRARLGLASLGIEARP